MSRQRPSRLVKRFFRSLVGLDVFQLRQCHVDGVLLGNRNARWFVIPQELGAGVVFSFGVGRDVSFELALIEQAQATVHAFDPTPRALQWARTQHLPDRFLLYELGVSNYDGTALFVPPVEEDGDSFSMVRQSGVGETVGAPVRRFETLVGIVGAAPDLVKMDIEGSEYLVLPDMLASGFRPRQILVEFHHRWREVGPGQTRRAISLLNRHGYRVADVSPKGKEYTFVLKPSGGGAAGRRGSGRTR